MENVRISVLSAYDAVCAFLDNKANDAMHFYDDELHQYLKGAANTYTFKTDAQHEKSIHLVEGNKLSFRYRNKDFYFNIMRVVRSEYVVEVEAYSLNFELLNENKEPYKAPRAMSIAEYLGVLDFEKVLTLKINEVSDKRITHEWTGTETMLARIFSLATVFDAEAEFVAELNDDYSLKRIIINLYRKNSDSDQGIGRVRTDIKLRYGVNISGVTKTSSITDLYTSIRPVGKDGLMIYNLDKTEYDSSGKIEFRSPNGDGCIRAVQARDRFPSNLMSPSDRYITEDLSYDTDNAEVLYGQALARLRKNCVPQLSYEVKGYVDTDIGDTVTIDDAAYNPHLYLQARVTEQIRSFTDKAQNSTKFDNFKELQSQIDPFLLQKMQDMINANKNYTCSIISNNGIVFKNGKGNTTLTASIMDVGKDVTGQFAIKWYADGVSVKTGQSIIVDAASIKGKSVYKYEATNYQSVVVGTYEVTVSNVDDGTGRVFILEASDETIHRALDGSLSRESVDFYAFYRTGDSVDNHDFYGKFVIDQTVDGKTWDAVYTSSKSENTVKYYLKWLMGNEDGSAMGNNNGDALGVSFVDVVQLRCRLFSEDGQSLIGVKSVTILKDGDPTGVNVSQKEPEQKFDGMLWKNTGDAEGLYKGATYRWDAEKTQWDIYTFRAENIEAESFRGYRFDGSIFQNDFDFFKNKDHVTGTSIMSDGKVSIESVTKNENLQMILNLLMQYDGIELNLAGTGLEKRDIGFNPEGFYAKTEQSTGMLNYGGSSFSNVNGDTGVYSAGYLGLKKSNGEFIIYSTDNIGNPQKLKTSNNSIIGAINEIYDMIKRIGG